MLGELAREREAHGGLDLARREGALLVVAHELAGLVGDLVEDVGDEGVHDRHALGRDARVGVHLLEHLVDVDGVGLAPLLLALPALGALTLKLLDLLFVRLGGHAAAEGLLPGEEGGVSSCDFVSAAALGGMPPPGPKAFFLDESSAPSDQTQASPEHKSARAWRCGNPQIPENRSRHRPRAWRCANPGRSVVSHHRCSCARRLKWWI